MEEIKCEQIGILSGDKWNKMHDIAKRVYGINGIAPTMHTCGGGNLEPKIAVPQATQKGYDTATLGDSINTAYPGSKTRRGRVGHGVAQALTTGDVQQVVLEPTAYDEQNGYLRQDGCVGTLTTDGNSPKHNNRVVESRIMNVGNYSPSGHNASKVVDTKGIAPTVMENHGTVTAVVEPRIAAMRGRNPDNPNDRTSGSQTQQRLEIGNNETSNTLTTVQKDNLVVEPQYRIRKLTERECFRLMGVKSEDFERVRYGTALPCGSHKKIVNRTMTKAEWKTCWRIIRHGRQSVSSCYHLAGDSIVTTCLMAIFGQLFNVDWLTKIKQLTNQLSMTTNKSNGCIVGDNYENRT